MWPIEFQVSNRFRVVNLRQNPLRSPPRHVVDDTGNKGLLAKYVLDLKAGYTELDRMRLMIVGYGGVGKTTLRHALQLSDDHKALASFQKSMKGIFLYRGTHVLTELKRC